MGQAETGVLKPGMVVTFAPVKGASVLKGTMML
jgi:hypothetical protein